MKTLGAIIFVISLVYSAIVAPICYLVLKSAFKENLPVAVTTVVLLSLVLVPYIISNYISKSNESNYDAD